MQLTLEEISQLLDCVNIVADNKYLVEWDDDEIEFLDSAYQKLMDEYVRQLREL